MKLSLRSLIATPLVAQVVVLTILTGWLAHRNGQASVETLAYHLLDETGEHLQHKLETYTAIPALVTQENLDKLDLKQLNTADLTGWFPHLFRQLKRFPEITYIYYGHTDGRYAELSRLPDGRLEFVTNESSLSETIQIYSVSNDGRLERLKSGSLYDPRKRPWYKAALKNQQPQWTGVYDFEDPSPTLGISFVRPYISSDKSVQGVLGSDFTLDAIDTFLERIQTRHSSAMFIMDSDGTVLASSLGKSLSQGEQSPVSSNALDQHAVVQTTVNHVVTKLEAGALSQSKQRFRFRVQNVNYWVQITPFADDYGLKWFGVSLLPEANFTSQIRANNRNTLFLCLLAMTVSSGVSLIIVRWINHPVQQLALAFQSILKGDVPQGILPSPIQEINLLVESFNHMGNDLAESRVQLKNYSHQLEELVAQRTQALQRSEETFAKAFQASPNAITLSTLVEGRYLRVNDRFVELMGIPRDEIVGYTSTELGVWIAPKTREIFYQELLSGRLRNQEWTVRKPSGELKTVLLSAEIISFQEDSCVLVIANDISDRITEQEQLRQSEERWQLALKGNNDGLWDWNVAAGEIFYSSRWKEILGYDADEISHDKHEWESRLHPEDRDRVLQETQAHLDQKTPFFTEEYRLRCKDGSYKWILDRGQALWNADGKPIRMVGSHTDISDRKRNENTIQQQEQFLRSIYNGIDAGIFVVDVLDYKKFHYVDSNATVKRISDAQKKELINASPEELFPPEVAVEIINKYQHCVDRQEPLTFEEQLLINDQCNWWLTTLNPLKNEQGEIFRIIVTIINITERKSIEEELAQQVKSEQLLTSISYQIRQSLDPQKTYQAAVDQIGLAFGASRCCLHIYTDAPHPNLCLVAEYLIPDYISRNHIEISILDNPYIQAVLSQDSGVIVDDVTQAPQLETAQPLLEQLQIKSMLAVRTSYQGQTNGVIEVHQCDRKREWLPREIDLLESVATQVGIAITQAHLLIQEHAQQEKLARQNIALEAAKQSAEQANRVKSEFLANMSHELRTPLNAILGFTQIMQRALKHDLGRFQQDAAKHLKIIQNSGDHLLTLINDVLDMAKIEAGHISLNAQPFNLHSLLQSLEVMFQPRVRDKGLTLNCEYTAEVPQYVTTDEAKLRQILINLLSNAVKFTHHGSILLRVKGVQTLSIEVEDTGEGISPHQLDRLFEAFYQTDTGRQTQGGTGLGLAISKTYVELLGGQLSVQSVWGQGSTFKFSLPITPVNQPKIDDQSPYLSVIRLAPHQPKYRILVVEDKWTSRTLLVQLLQPAGFDVREAVNGKEAIQIWQEWQPHLIWMDMRMPVMDGYEATKHIRHSLQGQATAIIALTASALESEKQIVLSMGCDDFVRKPFQDSTIFQKLQQHLGVQYVYENQQIDSIPTTVTNTSTQSIFERLSQQPHDWRQRLYQASSLADAEWVSQLIKDMSPMDVQLATSLATLVEEFRCDLIAELSAKSMGGKTSH